MPFQILVIEGPDKGRCFEVDDGARLTIGRGEKSHTKLDDAAVSRIHCEVARHGNTVTLKDLGSSSGTIIDGRPIDQVEIRLGTVFRIGDTTLRLDQPKIFGEETTVGGTAVAAAKLLARPLEELVGTSFGSYSIESIIGRGVSGNLPKSSVCYRLRREIETTDGPSDYEEWAESHRRATTDRVISAARQPDRTRHGRSG